MLTLAGCLSRRRRLWESVPDNIDWLLIADPRHVHYLSNFWVQPLSFSAGERGLLLLDRNDGATLLADNFARRSAASEPFVDREEIATWYDHQHSVINRDLTLISILQSIAERLVNQTGVCESQWLPMGASEVLARQGFEHQPGASIDLGSCIRQLRRQKEDDELALLLRCMQAGAAGHARAREIVRPGLTEFEVYQEVQTAAIQAAGRPGLVYGDFRALNATAPKAGGLPTDYQLQTGDLFLLDYSVVLDGYRSDFTNTICAGAPSDEQLKMYQLCQDAMRAGEATLRAGVAAKDVYAAVSQPLADAGYGDLPHHAGHGIGLGHPEPPILVPQSDDVLIAGDVVTLEPGLYVNGVGGMRIEHNYLVTGDGSRRLSNHVLSLSE